jgi:hypothetical protein
MGEFVQTTSKKKGQNNVKVQWNKKIANILYLPNLTIFSQNKSVTSFKTLQNGGFGQDGMQKTLNTKL